MHDFSRTNRPFPRVPSPFTISHAAAVIPLSRVRWLPLPALVVGTMVPALPMFLRAGPSYATTHALSTAVPVGVPFGFLLLLLFEYAKAPAIGMMPRSMRLRLAPSPGRPYGVRGLAALLLGVDVGQGEGFTPRTRASLLGLLLLAIPLVCSLWAWRTASSSSQFGHDFAFEFITRTLAFQSVGVALSRLALR